MEQTRRPCHLDTRFVQPGENHNWHKTADALAAIEICETACPISAFVDCARHALTSGSLTGTGSRAPRPATGIIAAGIVCRGSTATAAQLEQRIAQYQPLGASTVPTCRGCSRRLIRTGAPGEGEARVAARGLCKGCYSATSRVGSLAKVYTIHQPGTPCTRCQRPTVARGATEVPEGHTRYHSLGLCRGCHSQACRSTRGARRTRRARSASAA